MRFFIPPYATKYQARILWSLSPTPHTLRWPHEQEGPITYIIGDQEPVTIPTENEQEVEWRKAFKSKFQH